MKLAVAALGKFHAKPFGPELQVKQMFGGLGRTQGTLNYDNSIHMRGDNVSKPIEELSLMLSGSIGIEHCIGDWDNTITYSKDGDTIRQKYIILMLLDYSLQLYHIGIVIDKYEVSLVHQIPKILTKIESITKKQPKKDIDIHFTGKILSICNECTIDPVIEHQHFKASRLSLNISKVDDENIITLTKPFIFTPASLFNIGSKPQELEVLYSSHDYTIWKEPDNTIGYSLQMSLVNGISEQIQKQKELSQLTSLKDELKKYTTTKKLSNKSVGILSTAIRDTLEGDLQVAQHSLIKAIEDYKQETIINRTFLSLLVSIILIIPFSLFIFKTQNWFSFTIMQLIFWSLIGCNISILLTSKFISRIAHYNTKHFVLTLLLRNITGALSGMLLYLGITSNIILGFLERTNNPPLIALFGIVAGYVEDFIPDLFRKIYEKMLTVKSES